MLGSQAVLSTAAPGDLRTCLLFNGTALALVNRKRSTNDTTVSAQGTVHGGFEDVSLLVKCSKTNFTSTVPIIWDCTM